MGCFNYTCGYSNIHISSGDKVKLFFLVPSGSYNGCKCYNYDQFKVLGPAIDATYNDYGWFEFDETNPVVMHMQEEISSLYIHDDTKKRDRHGYFSGHKQGDLIPWDTIGSAIHDGEFRIKGNRYSTQGNQVFLEMIAMHSELVENTTQTSEYYAPLFNKIESMIVLSSTVHSAIHQVLDNFTNLINDEHTVQYLTRKNVKLLNWELETLDNFNWILDYSCVNSAPLITRLIGKNQLTTTAIASLITELLIIDRIMDDTHIQWLPQMTAGQEYDYEAEQKRINHIKAFVDKLQEKRNEECEW